MEVYIHSVNSQYLFGMTKNKTQVSSREDYNQHYNFTGLSVFQLEAFYHKY